MQVLQTLCSKAMRGHVMSDFTSPAVMSPRRFGSDAFLTDGCHLLQNLLSGRLAWRPQQRHGEMEDDVDEEVVTKYNQH